MSAIKKDIHRIKHLLSSKYGLRILSKIYAGHRPSQIAEQLNMPTQNVNYYTSIVIDLKLIEKVGDRRGIAWRVTERGLFILKQIYTRSVNPHKNNNNRSNLFYDAGIPIRLHDVSFSFKITSSLEHSRIKWKYMKNDVSRHTVTRKNEGHALTVDLVKSPNFENSVMLVR